MKIGFPRALFYYDVFPFWAGFFHRLGIELVTSPPTHRQIMEMGLKHASDETCLPVKILAGHIQALKNVDAIFLPRMVSVEAKSYTCPKFLGIPESVLSAVPPGMPVLTVTVNWREGRRHVLNNLYSFGEELGKTSKEIRRAFAEGKEWQKRYEAARQEGLDFQAGIQAITHAVEGKRLTMPQGDARESLSSSDGVLNERLKIALVGHPYLTQEAYANLNLLKKLRQKAEVKLVEQVDSFEVKQHHDELRKPLFWSHAKRIFGAGTSFVKNEDIDGVIYLSCFGCGTDSMVQDFLARNARKQHKPYMVVTLDEHSGEAGLVTRLEAFLDLIERRQGYESDVSAYGERMDRDSNTL